MAYGINPSIVDARREMLRDLEAGRPARWFTEKTPRATRKQAYEIREALSIAARYPDRYPGLAAAAENFSIFEVEDGIVEARPRTSPRTATSVTGSTPTHGLEPHGKPVSTIGLSKAYQCINSWYEHLPSSDPIHFLDTKLDEDELRELWKWAQANEPRLMMLVGDSTITLSLVDITVFEFAYNPPPIPVLEDENEEEFDL